MTDRPNSGTVSVSRELAVRMLAHFTEGMNFKVTDIGELRAILAQPAEQQDEPVCWIDEEGSKYRLCPIVGNLQIRHAPYGSDEAWLDVKMTPAHALTKLYRRPAAQAVKAEPEKCRVATCSQPAQHGRKYCRWDSDMTEDDLQLCGIISDLEDEGATLEIQERAVTEYWLLRKPKPAVQSVKLPGRMPTGNITVPHHDLPPGVREGWNLCLDAVAKLNGIKP